MRSTAEFVLPAGPAVDFRFLGGHIASMAAFSALSLAFYGGQSSDVLAAAWLLSGILAIAFGCLAFLTYAQWKRILSRNRVLAFISAAATIVACLIGNYSRELWPLTAGFTFRLTALMLSPILRDLIVDPSRMLIGTPRFNVEVAPECSGLEGVGLMLAFGTAWLLFFRKQSRFPQALLLLPAGVVVIFLLNSVRIAALILIGNAGAERIALGGFHSQAGWIAFNVVALGFAVTSTNLPWFSNASVSAGPARNAENPVAPWLVPLAAILAAGMLSHAFSGGFEWLYPLRPIACIAALLIYRGAWSKLDWTLDWTAPVAGVAVFAVWIGLDAGAGAMPDALASAAPLTRNLWLTARIFGGVVAVPMAEELAFRGFLYRRLIAEGFDSIPLGAFSWWALAASSLLFGCLHGSRWFVGTVAGAVYCLAMARKGRFGNAVAAHAVTNALIAADVLLFHRWNLW